MKHKAEFVEFRTKDGLTLPGLLYATPKSKSLAIFLHGNGSSSVFYDESKNHVFTKALAQKGISTLYFNNRGAHIVKSLNINSGKTKRSKLFGMAHEKIKECVTDIDGAIAFGKKRGFKIHPAAIRAMPSIISLPKLNENRRGDTVTRLVTERTRSVRRARRSSRSRISSISFSYRLGTAHLRGRTARLS